MEAGWRWPPRAACGGPRVGYGSSHSISRYSFYSFFVLRMFANPSMYDSKSVIGKSKARDLKVLQELSFITDAEAMTACCSVWVGF